MTGHSIGIHEIEIAVGNLAPEEFARFKAWFEELVSDVWDRQIESDAHASKFDHLVAEADGVFEMGHYTPL